MEFKIRNRQNNSRMIIKKCCGFLVGHVLCFRHNAFKDRAPDDKAVAARSAFLFG